MKKETGRVTIHGREYETVASRIKKFRDDHPDYTIETLIIERNEDLVVMKATIKDKEGKILATGHAEEVRTSSAINRTSAVENCETSAIGRALACLGYIGTEFASADEVAIALQQQQQPPHLRPVSRPSADQAKKAVPGQLSSIKRSLTINPDLMSGILKKYNVAENNLNELSFEDAKNAMIEFGTRAQPEEKAEKILESGLELDMEENRDRIPVEYSVSKRRLADLLKGKDAHLIKGFAGVLHLDMKNLSNFTESETMSLLAAYDNWEARNKRA